ncbi:hypothetical protein ACVCGS_19480 [Klebsiella pneumoniae]
MNSLFVSKPDSNFSKNRNYATALSFTRTTLASFISAAGNLEYAAINTPRMVRHPATRKILGMRVENSATNFALSALDRDRRELCAVGPDGIRASCRVVYPDRKHDE